MAVNFNVAGNVQGGGGFDIGSIFNPQQPFVWTIAVFLLLVAALILVAGSLR